MLSLTATVNWVVVVGDACKQFIRSLFEVNFLPYNYVLPGATYKILSSKGSLLTWRLQLLSQ